MMDNNAIIIHRLYRALVYAESKLKAEGLWSEVEDHTIGEPLAEYRQSEKQSAKGLKEALAGDGLEALDEVMDDRDTDVGC
jgi:hypothetical protein